MTDEISFGGFQISHSIVDWAGLDANTRSVENLLSLECNSENSIAREESVSRDIAVTTAKNGGRRRDVCF